MVGKNKRYKSQTAFSKASGMSQPMVSKLMLGQRRATLETQEKLAALFGIDRSYFSAAGDDDLDREPFKTELVEAAAESPQAIAQQVPEREWARFRRRWRYFDALKRWEREWLRLTPYPATWDELTQLAEYIVGHRRQARQRRTPLDMQAEAIPRLSESAIISRATIDESKSQAQ